MKKYKLKKEVKGSILIIAILIGLFTLLYVNYNNALRSCISAGNDPDICKEKLK